ncbi:hypothetical protein PACTADRAFT_64731 [Pachysolen tannophilus NRRL Y-2460]|uniref:Mitochondrial carrier protein n=1 Tax=Pachysolen tannophilus NRRL Y-2460 TaxID=669874 RepID=A0A1E4U3L7_PACTA|nr:hypothetical protein PACTADRAFT_64731 [Pachysolen tannophilus NRRL Y-2460]
MSAEEVATQLIDSKPESDPKRIAKDLFSGTMAGVAQVLTGMPFDTTKVRLVEGNYSGPIEVIKQLLKNEGILGFYKGTLTPLVGIGACVSIQFGVNEFMKRFFSSYHAKKGLAPNTPLSSMEYYLCGGAAGLANGLLASPIELIRIKLQIQTGNINTKQFNGPLDCFKKIYQKNGTRGIFKGIFPTLIREGHGIGIYFMTFEALIKNDMVKNNISRKEIPSWKLCLFGATAGYSMWCTAYPIDVIKTKLQSDNLNNPKYKTSLHVIKDIYKTTGYRGFFKGFVPTLLRAAPANAITFQVFELTMRLLD